MAEAKQQDPNQPGEADKVSNKGVGGMFYKLALAGVGSLMLAQEEVANFIRRGESASSDEGKPLPPGEEATDPEKPDRVDATIDRVLHTLSLPSRADVEALSSRIDQLATQIDTLRRQRGEG